MMVRITVALTGLLLFGLGGCGLPAVVTVGSYMADGVSALASGKTITDHAISVAVQEDCSLWRLVAGDRPCRPFPPGGKPVLVAAAAEWAAGGEMPGLADDPARSVGTPPGALAGDPVVLPPHVGGFMMDLGAIAVASRSARGLALGIAGTTPRPARRAVPGRRLALPIMVDGLEAAPAAGPAALPHSRQPPEPAEIVPRGKVLVIGSFRRIGFARKLAERWSAVSASIVPVEVAGRRFYRVVTAPTDADGIARQKRMLFEGGISRAWLAAVCSKTRPARPCVRLPGAIRGWRSAPAPIPRPGG